MLNALISYKLAKCHGSSLQKLRSVQQKPHFEIEKAFHYSSIFYIFSKM